MARRDQAEPKHTKNRGTRQPRTNQLERIFCFQDQLRQTALARNGGSITACSTNGQNPVATAHGPLLPMPCKFLLPLSTLRLQSSTRYAGPGTGRSRYAACAYTHAHTHTLARSQHILEWAATSCNVPCSAHPLSASFPPIGVFVPVGRESANMECAAMWLWLHSQGGALVSKPSFRARRCTGKSKTRACVCRWC